MSDDPRVEAAARVMGNVLCACGHELHRHDPENGCCDAHTGNPRTYGACPCSCATSPDPDLTLDELRAAAALRAADEAAGWEQVAAVNVITSAGDMRVDLSKDNLYRRVPGGSGEAPSLLDEAVEYARLREQRDEALGALSAIATRLPGASAAATSMRDIARRTVARLRVEDTPKVEEGT